MAAKKKLTKAQIRKRNEIADAIKREQPGISDERKFRIATAAAKKRKRKK